jgi:hypothetical protein
VTIPKTPKGISSRITKIRSQLSAFKREYGGHDDSGGARYYLAYLYFLLGDNRRSSEYMRWFEKSFPDDIGEPFQILCWVLMLKRAGKDADLAFGKLMLSNIYLIPYILCDEVVSKEMSHGSNWQEPSYLDYLPERIVSEITEDELSWMREQYESEVFQKILKRHIEIEKELQNTPVGDRRSALVGESYSLLDDLRQ